MGGVEFYLVVKTFSPIFSGESEGKGWRRIIELLV